MSNEALIGVAFVVGVAPVLALLVWGWRRLARRLVDLAGDPAWKPAPVSVRFAGYDAAIREMTAQKRAHEARLRRLAARVASMPVSEALVERLQE